jgi:hypothetical protein
MNLSRGEASGSASLSCLEEPNMIEILTRSTDTCLAAHFSGKVTGADYQQFLDALSERLKDDTKVNLVMVLTGLEFYGDFDSAKKDFKFGMGDYRRIHRSAFVGDQKWVEWFTRFVGPFTKAEERHFAENQLEEAINWAIT